MTRAGKGQTATAAQAHECPSPDVVRMVGREIEWEQMAPRKRHVKGICVGVRRSFSTIDEGDDGRWHGIQFGIQTSDGKVVWTTTFADHGAPA